MTKTETTQLAVAMNDISTMKDDITEIKNLLKAQDEKFAKFVEASEKKFITRVEAKVAAWIIGIAISVVTIIALFWGHK